MQRARLIWPGTSARFATRCGDVATPGLDPELGGQIGIEMLYIETLSQDPHDVVSGLKIARAEIHPIARSGNLNKEAVVAGAVCRRRLRLS